jgi:hypothetical protein
MAKAATERGESGPERGGQPHGPQHLNLAGLDEDDFEELIHQLVRVEFPEAEKLDRPDGGADTAPAGGTGSAL